MKFDEAARLQQHIQHQIPNWKQLCDLARASKASAAPSVLIISASAPRANDLAKLLPDVNKVCMSEESFLSDSYTGTSTLDLSIITEGQGVVGALCAGMHVAQHRPVLL